MKHYKFQLFIVVLLTVFISGNALASKKNDVVKISLPNKTAIEIMGMNINKYKIDTAFIAENIDRFFKFCKTSNVEELMKQAPQSFELKVVNGDVSSFAKDDNKELFYELNIDEREIPNQIISSSGFTQNLYYLQKHQLEFYNERYTYKIKFDELEQLSAITGKDIIGVLDSIMLDHYNQKSLHTEEVHYSVDKEYTYNMVYQNDKFANDQLELTLNTGLESVKNSWAANIETAMIFSFTRKGIKKNSYSLHYEWQYDFSNPNESNINQFVSLGYRHDFSKDPDNSIAYTFKLGYLVNKQGSLYSDDTFRLGISRPIGKSFSIEPQIYFNKFFKDVIPSIKIGIGF